jgi:NADH-quinone oxidoreductase subunit I
VFSAACPVGCILVIAAENTEENRVSPGERYAKTYEINMLRCIFCGYCEEACPVQAIVLGPEYELSDTSREKFIYTKEKLLEPLPPDVQARLDKK